MEINQSPPESGAPAKRTSPMLIAFGALMIGLLAGAILMDRAAGSSPASTSGATAASSNVQTQIDKIAASVESLNSKQFLLEQQQGRNASASFTFSDTGYGRLDTNDGMLFVTLTKVEPYLDGMKIYLLIGNPSTVRFNGFKLSSLWEEGTKDQDFTQSLLPGAWTSIDLIISPASPQKTKAVTLSLTLRELSLRK